MARQVDCVPFPYITGLTPRQQFELERNFLELCGRDVEEDDYWVVTVFINIEPPAVSGPIDHTCTFLDVDQLGNTFTGFPEVPSFSFGKWMYSGAGIRAADATVLSWVIVGGLYVGATLRVDAGTSVLGTVDFIFQGFA